MKTKHEKNNQIIGLKELRENAGKYISEVGKGKSFTVVRRSRPVFRITPPDEDGNWETVADFTEIKKGGVSARDILDSLKRYDSENR